MDALRHVLLVTNSATEDELILIKQALKEAKEQGMPIKLSLVHVIPNLPPCYFSIPSMVLVAEQYHEEAKKRLATIANELEIDREHQWLICGRMKTEVSRLAHKLEADFILASSVQHKSIKFRKTNQYALKNISSLGKLVAP